MATLPERKAKSKMNLQTKKEYAREEAMQDREWKVEQLPRGVQAFVAECGGPFAYDWEIEGDLVKFNGENMWLEEGPTDLKYNTPTVVVCFNVNGTVLRLPQCPEGAADTIERYLNQ